MTLEQQMNFKKDQFSTLFLYADALDQVAPLEGENKKLVHGLQNVKNKQNALAQQLADHDDKIAKLKAEYEEKLAAFDGSAREDAVALAWAGSDHKSLGRQRRRGRRLHP